MQCGDCFHSGESADKQKKNLQDAVMEYSFSSGASANEQKNVYRCGMEIAFEKEEQRK